jgi:GTP cyclohydrolase II
MIIELASRTFNTKYGKWQEYLYYDGVQSYIALVVGDIKNKDNILCRLHSFCMAAHCFNSTECDCREQMETAQKAIYEEGLGVIVWLDQEARGNGHLALMLSAKEKQNGIHQTEAYQKLGFPGDSRRFDGAVKVLKKLGVRSIRLMSNNPKKEKVFLGSGIAVNRVKINPDMDGNPDWKLLYEDKVKLGHSVVQSVSKNYDLAIFGDVNMDVIVRNKVSIKFADLKENGIVNWEPIDDRPGGTGLNFAYFAKQAGYNPFLIGKIGSDSAGRFLMDWLIKEEIAMGLSVSEEFPTGRAVIVRDSKDIRLLVDNHKNANLDLNCKEVRLNSDIIADAKFAYISGYALNDREANRFKAALEFMKIAAESKKTKLVFDLVPHRIYEKFDLTEFSELTKDVDILIFEVPTMRRFLGLGDRDETISDELAKETANELRKKNIYRSFVLRYGPSGCDEQFVWDGEKLTKHSPFGDLAHRNAEDTVSKRGLGDRMTLELFTKSLLY